MLTTPDGPNNKGAYDEITSWENIVAVSAGYGFTLELTADGNVKSAGNCDDGQRDGIGFWENIEINATVS